MWYRLLHCGSNHIYVNPSDGWINTARRFASLQKNEILKRVHPLVCFPVKKMAAEGIEDELVDYNEDEDTNLDTKDANEGKEVKK